MGRGERIDIDFCMALGWFVVTRIWDKIKTRALSEAYCFVNNQILFQYEKYC